MTSKITVTVNEAQVRDALELFEHIGGHAKDALRIAINKTGSKVRTASSQAVRSQIRLKAGYVNERLTFTRATRSNLIGRITTPSRGLLLSRFSTDALIASDGVSWIKPPAVPAQGIRVKVKPDGPTRKVGGDSETEGRPFYVVLKNSRAIGIAARFKGQRKFKVFHGPSISQVFNTVRDDILPEAGEELTRQMLDAIRYLTMKMMPPEE